MPDYDAIVAGISLPPAGASPNPYDAAARGLQADNDQAAGRAALAVSLQDTKPDEAALNQQLAQRYNTSPDVVAAYPQEFRDRMRLEMTRSALEGAPQLAQRIANNPQGVAVLADDVPNTAAVEKTLSFGDAANYVFSKGDGRTLLGDAGYYGNQLFRAGGAAVSPVFAKVLQAVGAPLAGVDWAAGTRMADLPFSAARWFDEYAQRYPIDNKAAFSGKIAQTLGSTLGLVTEALATGGSAAPAEAGATAAQAIGANVAHGIRAMMVPSAVASQQTAQDVIDRGGSVTDAVRAGTASYLVNTLGGVVPFATPGNLLYRLGSGALTGTLLAENSRNLMNWALPEDMRTPEPSAEERSLDALTGAIFGGMAGPRAAAHQLLLDTANAHRAEEDFQRLSTLGQLSAASKWRERDPEGFHDFIDKVTEDGQLPNVYVDARVFAQAAEKSGVDVQAALPDVARQLPEASMTDGFVRIPTADYAATIAGSPLDAALLPHLKTDPEGMSFAESQAFYQEQAARMQDAATQLVKGKQEQDDFIASQQRVTDELHTRLDEMGRFPTDVNKVYATVQSAILSRFAAQEGISPEQAAAKYAPALQTGRAEGLAQEGESARGSFNPTTNTISLLKDADLSTFLHETGHWALETQFAIARGVRDRIARVGAQDATPGELGLVRDSNALLKWFGVKSLEDWHGLNIEAQRPHHENFARAFEAYLMDGKAPNRELVPLFQRIRSWMVNIYKSLAGLNVQLSPEVRGVFDRMMASDDAIREAQAARVFEPLFKEKPAGVSAEDWARYQDMGAEATNDAITAMQDKSLRDMKWLSGAKSRALKDLQKQAKQARDAITREVQEEVGNEPVYRMEDWLKMNKRMSDADRDALKDWNGRRAAAQEREAEAVKTEYLARPEAAELKGIERGQYLARVKREMANEAERRVLEWEKQNPKPRIVKPDVDTQQLAELFGFKDGDEAMKALAEAPPRKEVIEGLTDRYMLERHGEMASPEALEAAASAAVHNDARARFVATGLKILTKSPIPAKELLRGAKEAAESAIGERRIRDLNPREHEAAETRANREALKLVAKDPLGAAQAQRASLLNNQLVRATQDAMADVRKGLEYFAKLAKDSVREKINVEFRDQIDALLARYDLRTGLSPEQAAEKNMVSLEQFVEKLSAMKFAVDVPEDMILNANRLHYKDMTVTQFRGLVDAVKSLDHLGREVQKVQDGKESRMLADVAAEAVTQLEKLPQRKAETNRGLTRIEEKWLGFKSFARSVQASLLKMEQMIDWLDDYNPNGVFNRLVFRKIADAEGRRNDLDLKIAKAWEKAVGELPSEVLNAGRRVYVMDGVIDSKTGQPQRLTWNEKIALAGIRGDAQHFSKLLKGERWDPEAVLQFLDRNMAKAEWDFVEKIAGTFQELFPLKQAMLRELGSTAPKEVPRIPFQTGDGERSGWYWPITYDPARSWSVAERHARHEASLFEDNIFTRADTSTGREMTRNDNYAKPMLLSIDVLPRVLKDEIRDITTRRAIIEADRFLSHPDVRRAVSETLSPEHYKQFNGWLLSLANDAAVKPSELQMWDRVAREVRTRATMVGLGFRVSTMVMHGATAAGESVAEAGFKTMGKGIFNKKTWAGLMKEIGPDWLNRGIESFARDSNWEANANFIAERSAEMRHRMNEYERDVREQLRDIHIKLADPATGAVERARLAIQQRAYQGIAMLDMASALPTWMGAYLKALSPKEKGGLEMNEQDAVYFADKTVRNAHGGGGVKDMAAIQRGNEFQKLFTMFYTFWNHNFNRIADTAKRVKELPRTYAEAKETGDWAGFRGDVGNLILRSFMYTLGVQAIHHMMHPPKEEDGEEGWVKWFAKQMASSVFGGVPIARDIVAHYAGGKDYEMSPATSVINNTDRLLADMKDGSTHERWIKHAMTEAGYILGLPLGQPGATAQFVADVWDGKQHPEDIAEWWRGLTTGDMHKH